MKGQYKERSTLMSYQQEEKLVRIRVKEGAHENTKVNKDGYRSCLQFDENNGMQGPLDYREVDIEEEIEKYWKDRQPSKVVPTSVDIKHDLIKDEFLSPKVKADLEEIGLMLLEIGVHEWKTSKTESYRCPKSLSRKERHHWRESQAKRVFCCV